MRYQAVVVLLLLSLAVAGCRHGPDYLLLPPSDHPASPSARAAPAIAAPRALTPDPIEEGAVEVEQAAAGGTKPAPAKEAAHAQH